MNRSPFPGMDPYVEPHWLDVHTAMISEARTRLNVALPDDLVASVEERMVIEDASGDDRTVAPDVRVFEFRGGSSAIAVAEPATVDDVHAAVRLDASEPATERFIRVAEVGSERLVSVIELVSPANKQGDGLKAFRAKRAELLAAGVNFVEIDLNRSGDWRKLLLPEKCPPRFDAPYRVTFRIPAEPGSVFLTPFPLREPLRLIRIPLRGGDPAVMLDLQGVFDDAYANGRYRRRLTYDVPLDPPLDPDDAAWVENLLRDAGKR